MSKASVRSSKNDNDHDKLTERMDRIENLLEEMLENQSYSDMNNGIDGIGANCNLPSVPERVFSSDVSAYREELIRYIDRKWVNGTKLRYYLFDNGPFKGTAVDHKFMREAFAIWEDVGIGLSFQEVDEISEAEIRIGFKRGDGSWSYVGRDILKYPGQFERTMNIGWDLRTDPRGVDTAVHEIGHTLGFPHEHQNPIAGIVWDEEAVYKYFEGPPNYWSRDKTYHNVLRKLEFNDVEGSPWDPDSIMHYGFGPGLILQPKEFSTGLIPSLGLSEMDKSEVRKLYPQAAAGGYDTLFPFKSQSLDIAASEQSNYLLAPEATRDYQISCFGQADVLMVLFRKDGDEYRYMAGSDDSGTETNASLNVRLERGSEYLLRVRLFAKYGSEQSVIMYW